MELDKSNMVSMLSFDSRCIRLLLNHFAGNAEENPKKYPLFYKNRYVLDNEEVVETTALDIALQNNQIRAANLIVDYIVRY